MQPVINPLSSLVSLGATAGAVAEAAEVLTRLAVSHGERPRPQVDAFA